MVKLRIKAGVLYHRMLTYALFDYQKLTSDLKRMKQTLEQTHAQ